MSIHIKKNYDFPYFAPAAAMFFSQQKSEKKRKSGYCLLNAVVNFIAFHI